LEVEDLARAEWMTAPTDPAARANADQRAAHKPHNKARLAADQVALADKATYVYKGRRRVNVVRDSTPDDPGHSDIIGTSVAEYHDDAGQAVVPDDKLTAEPVSYLHVIRQLLITLAISAVLLSSFWLIAYLSGILRLMSLLGHA
jgi:hypothetical protein